MSAARRNGTWPFNQAGMARDVGFQWAQNCERTETCCAGIATQLNTAAAEANEVVQAVDHFLGEELCIGVSAASRPFDSQRDRRR